MGENENCNLVDREDPDSTFEQWKGLYIASLTKITKFVMAFCQNCSVSLQATLEILKNEINCKL